LIFWQLACVCWLLAVHCLMISLPLSPYIYIYRREMKRSELASFSLAIYRLPLLYSSLDATAS
jgi:hypothetical protein